MSDIEIVRCRDCVHAEHRDDIERGKRACMVREGLGGFIVPEDGFCFMGEKRRDTCGKCRYYRKHRHTDIAGSDWDGICCAEYTWACGKDGDQRACGYFKPLED